MSALQCVGVHVFHCSFPLMSICGLDAAPHVFDYDDDYDITEFKYSGCVSIHARVISVRITPGRMQFTRTPSAACSFANPMVTTARMFTDTFTGIHPGSVLYFILAQIIGAIIATFIAKYFINTKN